MESVIKSAEECGTDAMLSTTDYVSAITGISHKETDDDDSALGTLNSACTDAFHVQRFSTLSVRPTVISWFTISAATTTTTTRMGGASFCIFGAAYGGK